MIFGFPWQEGAMGGCGQTIELQKGVRSRTFMMWLQINNYSKVLRETEPFKWQKICVNLHIGEEKETNEYRKRNKKKYEVEILNAQKIRN